MPPPRGIDGARHKPTSSFRPPARTTHVSGRDAKMRRATKIVSGLRFRKILFPQGSHPSLEQRCQRRGRLDTSRPPPATGAFVPPGVSSDLGPGSSPGLFSLLLPALYTAM